QKSYTILRIKRKRTEEPLDALVVDSKARRKRSRGDFSVFQFAGTERVASLARESSRKDLKALAPPADQAPLEAPAEPVPSAKSQPQTPRHPAIDPSRSYTVIPSEPKDSFKPLNPTAPPKILTAKDYEEQEKQKKAKEGVEFTIYDAVPQAQAQTRQAQVDPEVEKFLPLLQEYLKVTDQLPQFAEQTDSNVSPNANGNGGQDTNNEDYVWDIFYSRPASYKELFDSLNVGSVSGLPHSAMGYLDSDSDDDMDEEEDEDSNAEDFYKNDYPDSDSD
ncbi:hypothetical protein K474DRAFT_1557174, partial [Panus rudis PR-1116 ss-1]